MNRIRINIYLKKRIGPIKLLYYVTSYRRVSILHLSAIFLLDCETVPTVLFFLFFISFYRLTYITLSKCRQGGLLFNTSVKMYM
jgi:hypothetical protein